MASQPVTEMNPAPSEPSAQSRMSSGGLLDSGQREGHPCFVLMQACFYFLFFYYYYFPFNLQKAFNALCHSTHLYGRRLVLEWADTEESTVEALRRKTADHFHGNVAASFWPGRRSLAGTGPSGTRLRSAPALSPPRRGCQMDAGARRCQRRGSRPAEAGRAHRGGCAGGNLLQERSWRRPRATQGGSRRDPGRMLCLTALPVHVRLVTPRVLAALCQLKGFCSACLAP